MPETPAGNITRHEPLVYRHDREEMNGHGSVIVWFTGLSGAGKSTLAHELENVLHRNRVRTYVLDGDNIRQGLCQDLGFSDKDRTENIRRIGEVSKLMMETGMIVLTAFISPFQKDRSVVRQLVADADFIEVFCNASLQVCESRDPKGLYKKARAGELSAFTGISSPYERPSSPELLMDTDTLSVDECVDRLIRCLENRRIINTSGWS